MSHRIIQPDGWAPAKGYANGVLVTDGTLFVGGQIGWNSQQEFESDDFVAQLEQALTNILAVVENAGGEAGDITRLTLYITDKREYLARQAEVGVGLSPSAWPAFSGHGHGCCGWADRRPRLG